MPATTTPRRTTAAQERAARPSGAPALTVAAGATPVTGTRAATTMPGARSPWQAPPDPELDLPDGSRPATRGSRSRGPAGSDLRDRAGTRIYVRMENAIEDADDDSWDVDDSWDDEDEDDLGGAAGRACPDCGRSMAERIACLRGRGAGPARDLGAVTAEYAVLIVAVVGFAGLLTAILVGDEVRQMLTGLVQRALSV